VLMFFGLLMLDSVMTYQIKTFAGNRIVHGLSYIGQKLYNFVQYGDE
jgi:hypothetical protein